MDEVLRQRLMRRIESLPDEQIYQIVDYIEFLESKYARQGEVEPSALQKFAEGMQDKLRKKAMNPATLREAFQLIAAADKVLADVSSAGKQIMNELGSLAEPQPNPKPRGRVGPPRSPDATEDARRERESSGDVEFGEEWSAPGTGEPDSS